MIKQKLHKHVVMVLSPALLGFLSTLLGQVLVIAQNQVSMCPVSIIKGKF